MLGLQYCYWSRVFLLHLRYTQISTKTTSEYFRFPSVLFIFKEPYRKSRKRVNFNFSFGKKKLHLVRCCPEEETRLAEGENNLRILKKMFRVKLRRSEITHRSTNQLRRNRTRRKYVDNYNHSKSYWQMYVEFFKKKIYCHSAYLKGVDIEQIRIHFYQPINGLQR